MERWPPGGVAADNEHTIPTWSLTAESHRPVEVVPANYAGGIEGE